MGQWEALIPGGEKAARKRGKIIADQPVECRSGETDISGRLLATRFANGKNIAEELVAAGFAMAFSRYSDRYKDQAGVAKAQAIGLWSADFQPPWEFRSEKHRTQ